jgi:putative flippase GtrA
MTEERSTSAPTARRGGGGSPGARRGRLARQFGRFLIVGLGNSALSFVVYRLLLESATPYLLAAPVAFAAGAVNGYFWNRRWTFVAHDSTRARVLYVTVQAAGAGLTSVLVFLFARAGAGKIEAYLAAVPPITVAMFFANRLWTFSQQPQ